MNSISIFSAIDLVSYVFQGFLIAISALLYLQPDIACALLVTDALETIGGGTLFLIVCFTLGQANSSFSHLVLQQSITRFAIGRPSSYFLSFALEQAQPRIPALGRAIGLAFRIIWKPLTDLEQQRIAAWLKDEGYDLAKPDVDAQVFSRAFKGLHALSPMPANFVTLIFQFNFARNMTGALLVSVILLALADDQVSCGNGSVQLPAVADLTVAFGIALVLILVRFLYFFGVFTKNIIRLLIPDNGSSRSPHEGS